MPTLKPDMLKTSKDYAAIQKAMKADIKQRGTRKNLKFVAAKACTIGSKTIPLFIVTDSPAAFETVIKERFAKAPRSKGTCDIVAGPHSTFEVVIKSCSGSFMGQEVAKYLPLAIGSKKDVVGSFGTSQTHELRPVGAPKTDLADWAKQAYIAESVRTVIASMTSDRKIGSIYFEGDGRIRTTHGSGPQRSVHSNQTTVQFNISRKEAWSAFLKANVGKITQENASEEYKKWIKEVLGKATATSLPSWATLVKNSSTALDTGGQAPSDDTQLIEIFKGINGKVESWHPSRGAAVKFVTDKQTISVLNAAIKYIDGQGSPRITKLTDAAERNYAFYAFVKSRLPKFAPLMREPQKVKTK